MSIGFHGSSDRRLYVLIKPKAGSYMDFRPDTKYTTNEIIDLDIWPEILGFHTMMIP